MKIKGWYLYVVADNHSERISSWKFQALRSMILRTGPQGEDWVLGSALTQPHAGVLANLFITESPTVLSPDLRGWLGGLRGPSSNIYCLSTFSQDQGKAMSKPDEILCLRQADIPGGQHEI